MKISKRFFTALVFGLIFNVAFSQTTGMLSFSCSTSAPSGNWGNKHVLSVWIQNNESPSVFIKTNAKYGHDDDHLTSWTSISGKNMTDAISGATLSSYGSLSIEWDGTDVSHKVVMDGEYSIYVEMGWGKDKSNDHAVSKYSFTKSSSQFISSPSDDDHYSNISLKWEPNTTLISAVENEEGICMLQNPSNGAIKINFLKEQQNVSLEIADFSGKIIYSEHLGKSQGIKELNNPDFSPGIYFIKVNSNRHYFTYKILVEK